MDSKQIFQVPNIEEHVTLLVESYERICKKAFPIACSKANLVEALFQNKEYVIVSHGIQTDPVFNYANLKAQELWKMTWEEFILLPSRLSARPDKVEKREILLKEALEKGYIDNYEGIRVDNTGKEFSIKNVTLWNITDKHGQRHGQAAIFNQWHYI
jgi:hypothetical protein